jgi:glutamate-5-semialdehyde dehydrogenase
MDYKQYFEKAKLASRTLISLGKEKTDAVLTDLAQALVINTAEILTENTKDLIKMPIEDP